MDHVALVSPCQLAAFAVAFVANEPENDSQMQGDGGQEKFAGHLGIIYLQ